MPDIVIPRARLTARQRLVSTPVVVSSSVVEATAVLDMDVTDLLMGSTDVTVGFERSVDGVLWFLLCSSRCQASALTQVEIDRIVAGRRPSCVQHPGYLRRIAGQQVRAFYRSETSLDIGALVKVN